VTLAREKIYKQVCVLFGSWKCLKMDLHEWHEKSHLDLDIWDVDMQKFRGGF
jgi:hypothetical protein